MSSISELHREERDALQLMGYCQKILRGIEEPSPNSEQRAIWELVQNARDISDDCHIAIRLYPDRLEFAHQGAPFTNRTLYSLVIQSSSKDAEDAEQVGQYGTGFMTTHTFNTKVKIDGTYEVKDVEGKHVAYYPIDNFVLDRSGATAREIFDVMRKETIPAIDELENQTPIPAPRPWTVFTYALEGQMADALSKQLDEVMRLIPFVLIVNKSIKELRIENHISHTNYHFSKEKEESTAAVVADGWKKIVQTIRVCSADGEDNLLLIHTLQSEEAKDVIFIPPFEPFFGDVNAMPSLFLWFPLLGSEKFGVNFVFHSRRFYPVEQRNNIQLPLTNTKHPFKYQTNERVLNEMFDALFAYYRNEDNASRLPIECCRVHFPRLGENDDAETKRFYDELQQKWVEAIQTWKIIPTDGNGYLPMNDRRMRVLAPEFYENLSTEKRVQYEPIMRHFAEMVSAGVGEEKIILPKDDLIRWSQIVAEWNKDAEETFVTLKQVCECIKSRSDELHQFLEWLKELGQESLFDEYALIPNREGALCKKKDLRDGNMIPEALYRIARPIAANKLDVLVDASFEDICEFGEFTREDLRDAINTTIRDIRSKTLEQTTYNNYYRRYENTPRLLQETSLSVTIQQIIDYCSAFPTEAPSSLRWRMMPCVCVLFDCEFGFVTIGNEPTEGDEKPAELYEVSFNYLIEYTMYYLSRQKTDWLIKDQQKTERYQQLLRFVTEYAESARSNTANMDRLKKYAIFPNQRYELCKLESLKKNSVVKPDLALLYDDVMRKTIEAEWVEDNFSELVAFEEQKAMALGKEMEDEKLRPYLEKKRNKKPDYVYNDALEKAILQIINHLEKEDWTEYFDYLAQKENLRNISYELGTAAQKDALYLIKMGVDSQATLDRLASIAGNPKVNEILDKAEEAVRLFEEQKRQFAMTYEIGKLVETEIRSRISQGLDVAYSKTIEDYVAADEQNGQDIVIRKGTEDLFYIECKAKWNFSESAHMSSQQMKQAVRHKDEYALLCVDCTPDTGCKVPFNATADEVHEKIDDIIAHTHVHLKIGEQLAPIIGTEVLHEDAKVDEESTIKLYSSLSCNIPKKVFVEGISFEEFMQYLCERLKEERRNG